MRKFTIGWWLHPNKNKEWYEREKRRTSPDIFARDVDINYALSVSDRVFSNFDRNVHVSHERLKYDPHRFLYRIWDFGKTNSVLWVQKDDLGRTRVLLERVLGKYKGQGEDSTILDQVYIAQSDTDKWFPNANIFDICDPQGDVADGKPNTYLDTLRDNDINPYYDVIKSIARQKITRSGTEVIKRELQITVMKQPALLIQAPMGDFNGCPLLIEAMQGGLIYKKDTKGNPTDIIKEKHPYMDVVDCLIYYYLQTSGFSGEDDEDVTIEYTGTGINDYLGY